MKSFLQNEPDFASIVKNVNLLHHEIEVYL